MIYNYEGAILRYINTFIPEIKLMTYSADEDLLEALDTVKEFPAFFYSRENMDVEWNKPVKVPMQYHAASAGTPPMDAFLEPAYTFYPYKQAYSGTIFVENAKAAFHLASILKYGFNKSPKINVNIPGIVDPEGNPVSVPVSLFLTNISIDDVRRPNDKIGACRAVHFKWFSQLLMNDDTSSYNVQGVVEKVHIGFALIDYVDDITGEIQPMNTPPFNHPEVDPVYREDGYIIVSKN